jgi:phospholipase C
MGNYRFGNSQHPLDDVTGGEWLTKEVYETVRASPIWKETLLIITYDEHGGFFDHVIPPTTVAPGDTKRCQKNNFDFQQLGVRVPAVIISPLIEKNLIDKRVYDHSSILATLEKLFDMGSLTDRDASANHFLDLITLDAPRDTPLTLVSAADSHLPTMPPTSEQEIQAVPDEGVDSTLVGFVHVAKLRQMEVATIEKRFEVLCRSQTVAPRRSST